MPKTTVVAAKSECGGRGGEGEHGIASEGGKHGGGGGEVPLNLDGG